jgi:serine/threonine-protein kinase
MFYEMLSGKPPFEAPGAVDLMRQHMTRRPPPLPSSVPAAIAALAMEMLAKEPEPRPTMQQVLERLDQFSQTATWTVPITAAINMYVRRSDRRKRMLLAGAALAATSLAAGGLWLALRKPTASAPAPVLVAAPTSPSVPTAPPPTSPRSPEHALKAPGTPSSEDPDPPATAAKKSRAGKKNKPPAGFWDDPASVARDRKKPGR